MMKAAAAKKVAPVARASGGKAQVVSGNKNVIEEADKDEDGRKKGGAVKRKKGGAVRKLVSFYTGGTVKPRADRPGRKSGGGVGANTSPLSTAHGSISSSSSGPPSSDTYGGTPK